MDQKVTPDVLSFIANAIINLDTKKLNFTAKDVWLSEAFVNDVVYIFNKPSALSEEMENEYDKLSAQPLKTLSFGGVLKEVKVSNKNYYTILKPEVLSYLALNERNSLIFIQNLVLETFKQSHFEANFSKLVTSLNLNPNDNNAFIVFRNSFEDFMRIATNIRNVKEIRRILPKTVNPLLYVHSLPGARGGRISREPYLYRDLMYNATNFRDKNKNKNQARAKGKVDYANTKYIKYAESKIMELVKRRHTPNSEIKDDFSFGVASQVHHIYMKSTNKEFRLMPENLILLTATQHYTKAHPNNNTQIVDKEYQMVCLRFKLKSIHQSIQLNDGFYSIQNFLKILNYELESKNLDLLEENKATFIDIEEKVEQLLHDAI